MCLQLQLGQIGRTSEHVIEMSFHKYEISGSAYNGMAVSYSCSPILIHYHRYVVVNIILGAHKIYYHLSFLLL